MAVNGGSGEGNTTFQWGGSTAAGLNGASSSAFTRVKVWLLFAKAKLYWFSKIENWWAASIKKKNDYSMCGSLRLDLTDDIEHHGRLWSLDLPSIMG